MLAKQAVCETAWPDTTRECVRDYNRPCPFGWLSLMSGTTQCQAPLTYVVQRAHCDDGRGTLACFSRYIGCNRVQSFGHMAPAEKHDWARLCGQQFPCVSRLSCPKDWSAPCPADWYTFNGGQSCAAPRSYAGTCSSVTLMTHDMNSSSGAFALCRQVLNGLSDMSKDEKAALVRECNIESPCKGAARAHSSRDGRIALFFRRG